MVSLSINIVITFIVIFSLFITFGKCQIDNKCQNYMSISLKLLASKNIYIKDNEFNKNNTNISFKYCENIYPESEKKECLFWLKRIINTPNYLYQTILSKDEIFTNKDMYTSSQLMKTLTYCISEVSDQFFDNCNCIVNILSFYYTKTPHEYDFSWSLNVCNYCESKTPFHF